MSDILIGVLIGAAGPVAIALINAYFEDKREKEKLIYDLGKIYWQEALIKARESKQSSKVYPLETFIISIKYLFEEITNRKLTETNIKEIIEKHSKLVNIVNKHYDEK